MIQNDQHEMNSETCHPLDDDRKVVDFEDEQEREITMKSSSIALRWLSPKKEIFLVTWFRWFRHDQVNSLVELSIVRHKNVIIIYIYIL